MASSILNSDDGVVSGTAGLKTSGGDDGTLKIQANGVDAISIANTGAVTMNTAVTLSGGALGVASGGTGQTTYTNGQLLIGNTTGNTLTKATLTAGTGIDITNGSGSISIAALNNGTVTSVGGTGTVNGISLSGTVTSSGNLTLGGALSNVSLTSQVTGTLPVANGGTGATTLTANNVLLGNGTSALQVVAPGTSGNVLTSNGTTWTSAASPSGTVATTAEAIAGTNNTNFITPLRMREGFNAAGSAPVYACRAWVRFNGTTRGINGSGNVSSIGNFATGRYQINFSTAMQDANYALTGTAQQNFNNQGGATIDAGQTYATTSCGVFTVRNSATTEASPNVGIAIFR
jgi:hypothetical protein